MRRFPVALTLATVLLAPAASNAASITLNYAGNWGFFDPPSDTPEFHAAMAAYGIVFGALNPLSFSITVDPAVLDSDPSSTGLYLGAVVYSQLSVGSLTLNCAGPTCAFPVPNFSGPIGAAQLTSSSLQMVGSFTALPPLAGGLFAPSFISFQTFPSLASDSLTLALANVTNWPTPLIFIGFQGTQPGTGLHLGFSNLTLVSVPETETWAVMLGALLVFLLYRPQRRATRR